MNFTSEINANKARVETALARTLAAWRSRSIALDNTLVDAMEYGVLNGGKRLRPYLCYTTADILGANPVDVEAPAVAIELLHCYSLIHDDLPCMDDDDLRRGKPTVHKKFNEATAVLAGDALQTLAFEIISQHQFLEVPATNIIKIIHTLSHAAGAAGMCSGQAIDLRQTNKVDTLDALQTMHRLKTGALICAAVKMGALCANNVSEETDTRLTAYAENIGLAFQIQDDILDVTSDTQTLGKPQGSDAESDKITYVSLLGLDQAKQMAQECIDRALQTLQALPYNTDRLALLATYIINRAY